MNGFIDSLYRTRHIRASDVDDVIAHDRARQIEPAKPEVLPGRALSEAEKAQIRRLSAVQAEPPAPMPEPAALTVAEQIDVLTRLRQGVAA